MCNSTEIVENQEAAGAEKIGRGGHHGSLTGSNDKA